MRLAATVSNDAEAEEFRHFLDQEKVSEQDRAIRRIALRGSATDGVALSRTDLLPEVTITAEGVCAGIRSEPRMPIRLLRAIFFRWSNPSQLSGTLSIRREKTRTSWQESLTAAERQRQSNCLSRLGKQRLEEPLLGGGLPQGIVAIDMRR